MRALIWIVLAVGGLLSCGADAPSGGAGGGAAVSPPNSRVFVTGAFPGAYPSSPVCASDCTTCDALTRDLSTCRPVLTPPSRTPAPPRPCPGAAGIPGNESDFECGCGSRPDCPAGMFCAFTQVTCSCAPTLHSACLPEGCHRNADCGAGEICVDRPTGGICQRPPCAADADCTRLPGGICGAVMSYPQQSGDTIFVGIRCLYPTSSIPAGCGGATSENAMDVWAYCPG